MDSEFARRTELTGSKSPPDMVSEFARTIGGTGSDAVLFIFGLNIFESDQDLKIEGLSDGSPGAKLEGFSISELETLYLTLRFGRICLVDDLALGKDGPGDVFIFVLEGLGFGRILTFLRVGVGEGGIFI